MLCDLQFVVEFVHPGSQGGNLLASSPEGDDRLVQFRVGLSQLGAHALEATIGHALELCDLRLQGFHRCGGLGRFRRSTTQRGGGIVGGFLRGHELRLQHAQLLVELTGEGFRHLISEP